MVKNPPANAEDINDMGSVPGLGRSPGGGHGNSLQYFCLQNPIDRRAWKATVHRVTKSWTRLKRLSTYAYTTCSCAQLFLCFNSSNIYLFIGYAVSQLWHEGCLVVECKLLVAACRIQFPDQGSNPGLLCWERGVLVTGPPGKSLHS